MSTVTQEDRARVQSRLSDGLHRWAHMIQMNEENKREGVTIRYKDDAVQHVWSDVERYVRTGQASDALVLALLPKSTPASTETGGEAASTLQIKPTSLALAALIALAVIYLFFYR